MRGKALANTICRINPSPSGLISPERCRTGIIGNIFGATPPPKRCCSSALSLEKVRAKGIV